MYPMRYTDTFFLDPTEESNLGMMCCGKCGYYFMPKACFVRKDSDLVSDFSPISASGLTACTYISAVENSLWTDRLTEQRVRLGAVWEMNHHRRASRCVTSSWSDWPHSDELNESDGELIAWLTGDRLWSDRVRFFSEMNQEDPERAARDWQKRCAMILEEIDVSGTFSNTLALIHHYADEGWLNAEQREFVRKIGNKGTFSRVSTSPAEKEKSSNDALLGLLGQSNFGIIISAELLRYLGQFDDCLLKLREIDKSEFVDTALLECIEGLAQDETSTVGLIPIEIGRERKRGFEEGFKSGERINGLRQRMGLEDAEWSAEFDEAFRSF